jgi:hypothetical protein
MTSDDTVRPPRTSAHIPLAPPSQATLDAQREAEERAARAGGVHADIGQVWARKADGLVCRIGGYNGRWGMVTDDDTWFMVGRDELVDEWTFTGRCDHEASCCRTHGTHTMPHMGCILR